MLYTYDLWYNLPGFTALAYKVSIDAPSSKEAIALAQAVWDMLHRQGYYLQQRP